MRRSSRALTSHVWMRPTISTCTTTFKSGRCTPSMAIRGYKWRSLQALTLFGLSGFKYNSWDADDIFVEFFSGSDNGSEVQEWVQRRGG